MPVDKSVIDEQIKKLGEFDQWFTKKEIKYLPEVIDEGEEIRAMTSGYYEGNTWLVVVTTRRVLFLDKGMIYGLKQMEMPLAQITSISYKTGLMFGEIEVDTAGSKKKIDTISKKDVPKVAKIISDLLKQIHSNANATQASSQLDVISQLEKLAELKEKGILTEEEFLAQKAKLLG
ncbi:hypothetical protein DRP98_09690 [candidate division KSB1 bacterium]|nr:MAG: hypothetical protein DRP98_09690 [candidate division KSB1 bacterium]